MLFRFATIPASFQVFINKILAEKFKNFVIIYVNNILIYIDKKNYINFI